jgi:hypothetical protein
VDFNPHQISQGMPLKGNKPIAAAAPRRKVVAKAALFGSQNGTRTAAVDQRVPFVGKLTFDGASSTQNCPGAAKRGLDFVSFPGRSARAHGLTSKQAL